MQVSSTGETSMSVSTACNAIMLQTEASCALRHRADGRPAYSIYSEWNSQYLFATVWITETSTTLFT